MAIKEISVLVSRTFNLGNFESLRLEAGAAASVDEAEEDIETARATLFAEVRQSLRSAYSQHHPKAKTTQEENGDA